MKVAMLFGFAKSKLASARALLGCGNRSLAEFRQNSKRSAALKAKTVCHHAN